MSETAIEQRQVAEPKLIERPSAVEQQLDAWDGMGHDEFRRKTEGLIAEWFDGLDDINFIGTLLIYAGLIVEGEDWPYVVSVERDECCQHTDGSHNPIDCLDERNDGTKCAEARFQVSWHHPCNIATIYRPTCQAALLDPPIEALAAAMWAHYQAVYEAVRTPRRFRNLPDAVATHWTDAEPSLEVT